MRTAFRIRVNMSAIGSLHISHILVLRSPGRPGTVVAAPLPQRLAASHQLAFFTPGIKPWLAILRKQMRHSRNLRYTARYRPHTSHRRTIRHLNFGGCLALYTHALLPSISPVHSRPLATAAGLNCHDYFLPSRRLASFRNGMPSSRSSSRLSLVVLGRRHDA